MNTQERIELAHGHLRAVLNDVVKKQVDSVIDRSPGIHPDGQELAAHHVLQELEVTFASMLVSSIVASIDRQHPDLASNRALAFALERTGVRS